MGSNNFGPSTHDEVLSAQAGAADVRGGVGVVHGQRESPLVRLREHLLAVPAGLLVPLHMMGMGLLRISVRYLGKSGVLLFKCLTVYIKYNDSRNIRVSPRNHLECIG